MSPSRGSGPEWLGMKWSAMYTPSQPVSSQCAEISRMSSQGWAAAGQMLNRMTGILKAAAPAARGRCRRPLAIGSSILSVGCMSIPDPLASLPPAFFTDPDVQAVSIAVETKDGSWTFTSTGIKPETLFQAASISKAIAALAAMALVDDDVIDLDKDVNDYLTSWKLPAVPGCPLNVSVRHLLCHGGAISVRSFPGYPQGTTLPSLTDILDGKPNCLTTAVRRSGLPGLTSRYSGGGYT